MMQLHLDSLALFRVDIFELKWICLDIVQLAKVHVSEVVHVRDSGVLSICQIMRACVVSKKTALSTITS